MDIKVLKIAGDSNINAAAEAIVECSSKWHRSY